MAIRSGFDVIGSPGVGRHGNARARRFEMEDPADQPGFLSDAQETTPSEATHSVPILGPRRRVPRSSFARAGSRHPAPACERAHERAGSPDIVRDMGLDSSIEQVLDHPLTEIPLVAPGSWDEAQSLLRPIEQRLAALGFEGRGAKDLDAQTRQDPIPVLHPGIHRVAGLRPCARRLQRSAILHCSSITSLRSLGMPSRIAADQRQEQLLRGDPRASPRGIQTLHAIRIALSSISGRIRRNGFSSGTNDSSDRW